MQLGAAHITHAWALKIVAPSQSHAPADILKPIGGIQRIRPNKLEPKRPQQSGQRVSSSPVRIVAYSPWATPPFLSNRGYSQAGRLPKLGLGETSQLELEQVPRGRILPIPAPSQTPAPPSPTRTNASRHSNWDDGGEDHFLGHQSLGTYLNLEHASQCTRFMSECAGDTHADCLATKRQTSQADLTGSSRSGAAVFTQVTSRDPNSKAAPSDQLVGSVRRGVACQGGNEGEQKAAVQGVQSAGPALANGSAVVGSDGKRGCTQTLVVLERDSVKASAPELLGVTFNLGPLAPGQKPQERAEGRALHLERAEQIRDCIENIPKPATEATPLKLDPVPQEPPALPWPQQEPLASSRPLQDGLVPSSDKDSCLPGGDVMPSHESEARAQCGVNVAALGVNAKTGINGGVAHWVNTFLPQRSHLKPPPKLLSTSPLSYGSPQDQDVGNPRKPNSGRCCEGSSVCIEYLGAHAAKAWQEEGEHETAKTTLTDAQAPPKSTAGIVTLPSLKPAGLSATGGQLWQPKNGPLAMGGGDDKILFLDAQLSGADGSMVIGALLELGVPIETVNDVVCRLGLGWRTEMQPAKGRTVSASRFSLGRVNGAAPIPLTYRTALAILESSRLAPRAEDIARRAVSLLAETEAAVQGVAAEDVVLDKAAGTGSFALIVAAAVAVDFVGASDVITSPLPIGRPAVLRRPLTRASEAPTGPSPTTMGIICRCGLPTVDAGCSGDFVTPLAASLIGAVATHASAWPSMLPSRCAYGAGTAGSAREESPLRLVLGEPFQGGPEAIPLRQP